MRSDVLVTFCLSVIMVQGYVLLIFSSSLSVSRNHFHVLKDPTSTTAIAIGNIQSFGSTPTAVKSCPPNLVLMWHPSKQIIGLQPLRNPLLQATSAKYKLLKCPSDSLRNNVLPGLDLRHRFHCPKTLDH